MYISKNQNYLYIITILLILAVGWLIISNDKYQLKQEGFADYQDVKTKTLNWCNKLQANGLLTSDQYNQCVSSFHDTSIGTRRVGIDKSRTGMDREYSLYNTRKNTLSSNPSGEDNSNTIMLSNNNLTLGCRTDGSLYTVTDINDPNVNQRELYFTMQPINENIYSIISPNGLFLIADNKFNASFTGKSAGPTSSWTLTPITDMISSYENVNKVMLESLQFPDFRLVFKNLETENDVILQIEKGRNDDMIWSIQYKSNLAGGIDNDSNNFNASQLFVIKENLLINFKKLYFKKLSVSTSIDLATQFMNLALQNISDVKNYLTDYLQNQQSIYNLSSIDYKTRVDSINGNSMIDATTKENLIRNISPPEGLNIPNDTINTVLTEIDNYQNMLSVYMNSNIKIPLQQKLAELNKNDTSQSDYEIFLSELNRKINDVNNDISQNRIVIKRMKDSYNSINEDYNYQSEKIHTLENINTVSGLNSKLVSNYEAQKNYLNKIYPFIAFVLFLFFMYLAYITGIKFKKNIWSKYKE